MNNQKKETKISSLFSTYALISIFLLIILLVVYGFNQLRREKIEMYGLLQHQGEALIQSMEIAWQNAILSDSLVRQLIAERLLDNAYLIDHLIGMTGDNPLFLKQLVRDIHLFRVIVTDALGRVILDSQGPLPSPSFPSPNIPYDTTRIVNMVNPILCGIKSQLLTGTEPVAPFQDDLLWVAVARRGKPGAIIILVQAEYLKHFRSEIGLHKIIKEIGSKPGIEYLVYEDIYNRIAAQKGESGPLYPIMNKENIQQSYLKDALITKSSSGKDVLEIRHPFSFAGKNIGLIRVGLPLSKLKETERSMKAQALWFGCIVILLGIIGILLIFFYQYKHYTFQKMREEETQRVDKLISIGKLAAGVAHEIRNPLNAISMAIQRLQQEFLPIKEEDKEGFIQFTCVIRDEIKRVDRIITEFLGFARQSRPEKQEICLSKLVNDLLIVLDAEAEKNRITLQRSYPEKGEIQVSCDPNQIKQCLINIIKNAIQAMPNGGTVTIGLNFTSNEAMISVSDTGPGIESTQIERIFEFYYTDKEGGIGLGLPISQKIIEEHGGSIEVQSEVGKGSQFIIHLPIATARPQECIAEGSSA